MLQGGSGGGALQSSRLAGGDQFNYTDIRYDEDYEKFYQFQAAAGVAGLKLPPPLDTRTLYNDLPQFSRPLNGLANPLDLDPVTSYGTFRRCLSSAGLFARAALCCLPVRALIN